MTATQPDLFGHPPNQSDLFAEARPVRTYVPDPDDIRRRLLKLLGEAKAAKSRSPWTESDTRLYQTIFPQMANWLPDDEANQLRFEFARELERLRHAA